MQYQRNAMKNQTNKNRKKEDDKNSKMKWVICYVLLCLALLFLSNIFMHIFILHSKTETKKELNLLRLSHCEWQNGQYVPTGEDPQLHFVREEVSAEVQGVYIEFGEKAKSDILVEIYYPNERGEYSEERMVKAWVKEGEDVLDLSIEPGEYSSIRVDINERICLNGVYESSERDTIFYANHARRYQIWLFCILLAALGCVCIYRNQTMRGKWDIFYQQFTTGIAGLFHSRDFHLLWKLLLGGVLLGAVLEGIIAMFASHPYNDRELAVFAAFCTLILSFLFFRDSYRKRLELVFFIIFIYCGLVFLYVMPVSLGVSWDDEVHYYRVVSLARLAGGNITQADKMLVDRYQDAILDEGQYTREQRRKNEKRYTDLFRQGLFEESSYSVSYKDISYLPYVIGIWVSYGLGLSFCATLIMGKFFNLLWIGILLYLSLRNVKTGKMPMMVFAMVPTVFFLVVSYSYDSWLTFLLLYAFSRYFRELQNKEKCLTFANFLAIFIPAFLSLFPKLIYAPILFMMAYMPKEKFKEKKWRLAYQMCFVLAGVLLVAGIAYIASGKVSVGIGDTRGGAEVNGDLQLKYIINHFGTYCVTLRKFLKEYFSYHFSIYYLTCMAYMGSLSKQYISIVILLLALVWDRSMADSKTVPLASKAVAFIMPWIVAVLCATSMYILFTPVGLGEIYGCQGRYILPVVIPVTYMISRTGIAVGFRKKIPEGAVNMAFLLCSVSFLLYNLWINCVVKY